MIDLDDSADEARLVAIELRTAAAAPHFALAAQSGSWYAQWPLPVAQQEAILHAPDDLPWLVAKVRDAKAQAAMLAREVREQRELAQNLAREVASLQGALEAMTTERDSLRRALRGS